MLTEKFSLLRDAIETQYQNPRWNDADGWSLSKLESELNNLCERMEQEGCSKEIIKAKLFEMTLSHAQLAAEPKEWIQDHINHGFFLQKIRERWIHDVMDNDLSSIWTEEHTLYKAGVLRASYDFGHTVPDWYDIMKLGLPGLLERVEKYHAAASTPQQEDFYTSCEIVYRAAIGYCKRLAAECRRAAVQSAEDAARLMLCSDVLEGIAEHAPQSTHEALQLAYLFHIMQEEIEGERLRSLGGLDRVYLPFYQKDMAEGRYTKEEIGELFKDFFQKFHALTGDHLFGEPMYLGGTLPDGTDAVNELTWLILDSYDALNIANPKFHIRISKKSPVAFISRICDMIRGGNSSFVFVSDECAIPMMMKVGATLEEAREVVPIGCYEPGILGREVACTGNGGFNMPKALELTLHNGIDPLTGNPFGMKTGDIASFGTFAQLVEAVRQQMKYMMDKCARIITSYEREYMRMNPAPLFSATMIECVEKGMDAYAGGAKYNNSSLYMYSNATLVDSLAAIDKLVYRNHEMTLPELVEILDKNWEGHESLRLRMLRDEDKWGNDRELPDALCVDLCQGIAEYGNTLKNGRGGRFKVAMYTIDFNYYYGEHVGATPDGRLAGQILSRNLGATSGMDRSGITALIRSCCKLDLTEFPTGTVVDLMLHPTAVAGDEGLAAFTGIIQAYMDMGGYAIHGNVFDARVLRAAQKNPEQYKNLQVRVCGWNVYFVNLSRKEQDEFIRRAELAAS